MQNGHDEPRLLAVEIRNFRGARFVRIDFKKAITTIGGKNGAGKTSTLEGIRSLLAGDAALPAFPIHDEADSARLFADLGTMTIEKVIAEGKKPKLVVKGIDGQPVPAPQRTLAEMYDSLTFDPSEFVTMKPEKQDEELRAAIGLDLSDLEAEHVQVFNERTAINREVKALEGRLTEKVYFPNAPEAELSTAALLAELEEHDRWAAEVNLLGSQLAQAKRVESEAKLALEKALDAHKKAMDVTNALLAKVPPERPGAHRDDIKAKLDGADETNRKVRSNAERAAITKELNDKRAKASEKSARLEQIDELKAQRIAEAKFPIDGLTFDKELGPCFNGHPLKQCGEAELWLLSCALCMVRDPKLKFLLIRRGSQLDDDALAKLYALAEQKDFKLLIEVVTRKPADEECVDVMVRNGVGEQRA